jgi:hypothetical protein
MYALLTNQKTETKAPISGQNKNSKGDDTEGTEMVRGMGKVGERPRKRNGRRMVSRLEKGWLLDPKILGCQDPSETAALLRKELILARSHGAQKSAQSKHYYLTDDSNASTTEKTLSLCRVTGGTASNTRTTNSIRLKHSVIRVTIRRVASTTSTTNSYFPIISFVFWREKVPAVIGTPPTVYGTDANPPASTTLLLSRLGNSDPIHNTTAVFNPVTALDYHIYHVKHLELNCRSTYDYTTPATAYGIPSPDRWEFQHRIDFNDADQNYATYAATDADVNAVWMTYVLDTSMTNQGYVDEVHVSIDTEFEDMQDGE